MNHSNKCITDRVPVKNLVAYAESTIRKRVLDQQNRIKMPMHEAFILSTCLSSVETYVALLDNILASNRTAVQTGAKSKDVYETELSKLLELSTAPFSFTCISLLKSFRFDVVYQLIHGIHEEEVLACSWLFYDIEQAHKIVKSVKHQRET